MIELYEAFCKYLERGKKTSANTIASYRRDVKSFIIFLHENGIYSPDKIDNAVISKYITALKRQKKSCATICPVCGTFFLEDTEKFDLQQEERPWR